MNNSTIKLSTWIGAGALLLWVIEPLLVSELIGFPLFEALFLIFTTCFIVTAIRITVTKQWHDILKQPIFVWAFGTIAICGSDFCYILGAHCAPIAHIDLIDYMWPCFIIFFIGFLPNQKFSFKYLIGAILGFIGILQLITYDNQIDQMYIPSYWGYLLAFFGVIIWGAYSTYSSYHKEKLPVAMIGLYCGIAALICGILHVTLETTVTPTLSQGLMTITLGLVGPGLAYQLWDYGMKFGNARLLSVSCYFARIMSMALLVWFNKEPYSNTLVIACILAITGVFISSVDERWLKDLVFFKFFKTKFNKKLIEEISI